MVRTDTGRERMPRWLLRRVQQGPTLRKVERVLEEEELNTVCVGARCPNRGECYSSGTATFMMLGRRCTRNCGFCSVPSGNVEPVDEGEPEAVARAAEALGLKHVVVTSVTRDDLPDGGSAHISKATVALRKRLPRATVELLIPDFRGDRSSLEGVLEARPDVLNHNVETVERIYAEVRPGADYRRSLELLKVSADEGKLTKSGLMVGLGETTGEVERLLIDLREAGCRMVTIGQYLRPAVGCLPVRRYWEPREFESLREYALGIGFDAAAAGPFVRSSYFAGEMFESVIERLTADISNVGALGT